MLQKKGFKDVLTLIILVRVQSPSSAFRFAHVVPGQSGLYARGEREPVIVLESW